MKTELYTIVVRSENKLGLLNRISSIFLKKRININDLRITNSKVDNLAIFTLQVLITREVAKNIIDQITKQIDVISASYHTGNQKTRSKTKSNSVLMRK